MFLHSVQLLSLLLAICNFFSKNARNFAWPLRTAKLVRVKRDEQGMGKKHDDLMMCVS